MVELKWTDIGIRLKSLRVENKLTIERLSEIIEVSTSFIGLVERGESGLSIENIFKLSRVFNVSVDYILTGESTHAAKQDRMKFDILTTSIYDYSEEEINFLLEMAKFLKPRVKVVSKEK